MPRLMNGTPSTGYARFWYDSTRTILKTCDGIVPPVPPEQQWPWYPCRVVLDDGTPMANRDCGTLVANGRGFYATCGGGGGVRVYTSLGAVIERGAFGPSDCASPDNAIAYKREMNSYGPWDVREANGETWSLTPQIPDPQPGPGEADCYDVQLLGSRRALWTIGGRLRTTPGLVLVGATSRAVWSPLARVGHDGAFGLSYQDQATQQLVLAGHVIGPSGIYTRPDWWWNAAAGLYEVVWSTRDNYEELDAYAWWRGTPADLAALPLVDAAPPVTIPTFSFTHPVIVAPFKDPEGATAAPMEIVVNQYTQVGTRACFVAEDSLGSYRGPLEGIYSEAPDPSHVLTVAEDYATRLMLAHDSTSDWVPPPGLRAYDVPWLELYLSAEESLDASVARWRRQAQSLLQHWHGSIGVIPMFYCMGGAPPDELFTVAQVCDGLAHLSEIVNLDTRIIVIAPFAYLRANGISAHPEFLHAFDNLLAEQRRVGLASLPPVSTTPVPPDPIPPDPEPEPEPEPEPDESTFLLFASVRRRR